MDHRTALATFRKLALRTGATAGRVGVTATREVRRRIAARGSARVSPPVRAEAPAAAPEPAPHPDGTSNAAPGPQPASPALVARAVARNDAGLPRTNPGPTRATPRRSAPGAKLPARAGQGILGV